MLTTKTAVLTAVLFLGQGQSISVDKKPHTTAELLRNISTYSVRVRRDNEKSPAIGSGTVINTKNGNIVLTCAHVVGKETSVLIDIDIEGRPIKTLPAMVEKVDEKLDLAALRIIGGEHIPSAILSKDEPALYDELYVIGSPVSVTRQSSILRLNTKDAAFSSDSAHALWTVSGSVVPGMSGAGIFDANGEVVAIVRACFTMPQQILTTGGFVIPITTIREFIKGI